MRILALALGLLPITALAASDSPLEILDLKTADRPTIEQAAVQARWLLRRESVGTLSTVFQKGAPDDLEGLPIGLMDYYADCSKDGTPALLGLSIATS